MWLSIFHQPGFDQFSLILDWHYGSVPDGWLINHVLTDLDNWVAQWWNALIIWASYMDIKTYVFL